MTPTITELAHDLHHALAQSLLGKLTGNRKVSTDFLAVAGRYLRDMGLLQGPTDRAGMKRLQRIERAYLAALLKALQQEKPSAGLLAEVRRWCESAGVTGTSGPGGAADAGLTAAGVPFGASKVEQ